MILQKIESPSNVNSLAPDGKLRFSRNGLDIIYGENGSGKTGYGLKKCCKASHIDSILQNVFKNPALIPVQISVKKRPRYQRKIFMGSADKGWVNIGTKPRVQDVSK